jgi:hypothetical protein
MYTVGKTDSQPQYAPSVKINLPRPILPNEKFGFETQKNDDGTFTHSAMVIYNDDWEVVETYPMQPTE